MSAQLSRLKKKMELYILHSTIRQKDENIRKFMKIVSQHAKDANQMQMLTEIQRQAMLELKHVDKEALAELAKMEKAMDLGNDKVESEISTDMRRKPSDLNRQIQQGRPIPIEKKTSCVSFEKTLGDLLTTSDELFNKFAMNEEKDEEDYRREEEAKLQKDEVKQPKQRGRPKKVK